MGNNSAAISIILDRAQPTIYYTGDIISGQILCTVSQSTSTPENIHLTVNGHVGYAVMHRSLMQNGQTNKVTNHHDIRILRQRVKLGQIASSDPTQASNTSASTTTLETGRYVYPFSIRLPDGLPPTLHPQEYPFVRYQLELCVEQKWYVANTNLQHPLRIYPRVNLRHISNASCSVKFIDRRHDLTVKGVLQRSGLVPGEEVMLSFNVYNPLRLLIKCIDVCLIQRYQIEQCRRRVEMMRMSVPESVNLDDADLERTCPLFIPECIAPSYSFEGRGDHCRVHVSIHYDIKLEIKAKGLLSDFELHVPVTVGTDLADDASYGGSKMTLITQADLNVYETLERQAADNDEAPSSPS